MRNFLSFARTVILGGVLFLVPFVLLVVVLERAFVFAHRFLAPVAQHFPENPVLGVAGAAVAAALVLPVLCFGAGLVARTAGGQRFFLRIEESILSRVPGYTMYRGALDDLERNLKTLGSQSTRAVLVRIEDAWQIGFVSDELDSGELAVFVPGAPSPMSGSLFFLEPDRVRDSGLSVNEAMAMLRRIGVGSAQQMRGKAREA
jgi:uncharacterized membrane protein